MILIIAEKPSLGRNIADAIGAATKRNGYIEGNGYLVTWAFGHLFSLADVEAYSAAPSADRRWTMDSRISSPRATCRVVALAHPPADYSYRE